MSESAYRTEILRLSTGERIPLLVDRTTGLPDARATAYTVSVDRTKSWNTAKHHLDAIGLFYEWAAAARIDLDHRFGTAELFNQEEVHGLSASLRLRRQSRWNKVSKPEVVIADTHGNRINAVCGFIRWRGQGVLQAMRLTDERLHHARERLDLVLEGLGSSARSGGSRKRQGLTEDQQRFLLEVIRPDHPNNPFSSETRLRNFALVLMMFEFGVRRGEPLLLKSKHVLTSGARPSVQFLPMPNDPEDMRRFEPRLKTGSRLLFMSPALATAIDDYIMHERAKVPNARKARFLFIDSKKGMPLSLRSLYDLFVTLRSRFPEQLPPNFSPHVLRHTFNGRFSSAAKRQGLKAAEAKLARNHVLGWKKHSDQGAEYDDSEILRDAEQALADLQDQLVGLMS